MLPGMELMGCQDLAVPAQVMEHVVKVESSGNPYAIGVVGTRLARQPRSSEEAVATARMLEAGGYNFSLGLAQVNRYNLAKYGLASYEAAFQTCPNLRAGSQILAECHSRSGNDWGKAFSCYYSGNFTTGFRHGYVQRVFASMGLQDGPAGLAPAIGRVERRRMRRAGAAVPVKSERPPTAGPTTLVQRRGMLEASQPLEPAATPFVVRPAMPAIAIAAEVKAQAEVAQTESQAIPKAPEDLAFVF